MHERLTVEVCDALDVVRVQLQVGLVSAVKRRHDGVLIFWMAETERVTEFMGSHLEQVGSCTEIMIMCQLHAARIQTNFENEKFTT